MQRKGLALAAGLIVASNLATGYAARRVPVSSPPADTLFAQRGPFVVLFGDSITAAAPLPASVCGLPLVNAGKSGSRASTFIPVAEDMNAYGLSPTLVVVALGVNDAIPAYHSEFASAYRMLLDRLPGVPLALATLTPADLSGSDGKRLDPLVLRAVDATIRASATERNATLIDLKGLTLETRDGLHPTAASYPRWVAAVVGGIESALGCESAGSISLLVNK